jgi:hypothetical protein
VTLSVSDGVVTDTLTRTNYITVSSGIAYTTTTRVTTYTYDKLYRLTDADWEDNVAEAAIFGRLMGGLTKAQATRQSMEGETVWPSASQTVLGPYYIVGEGKSDYQLVCDLAEEEHSLESLA